MRTTERHADTSLHCLVSLCLDYARQLPYADKLGNVLLNLSMAIAETSTTEPCVYTIGQTRLHGDAGNAADDEHYDDESE